MDKLCRLCLGDLAEDGSVPVFTKDGGTNLSEMIFVCTSIKVKQEDLEPNCVCTHCSEALIQCNNFREKCLKSEKLLINYRERQTKGELLDLTPNGIKETMRNEAPKAPEVKNQETSSKIKPVNCTVKENNKKHYIKKKKLRRKTLGAVQKPDEQTPIRKTKPVTYKCEFCSKIYPSEGGWRYHVHTMHSQTYQPFLCDLCGKAYKAKKNLEVHKRSVHYKVKENLCDKCGAKFATKYGLRVHQVWHTGEKKYECKVCDAKFASNGKLNTHLIIHEGFKKFMCEICSRVFRWKKDFAVHMRTHTGEKPYACQICNKAFASLTNKRKHETSHSRSKNLVPSQIIANQILKTDSTKNV